MLFILNFAFGILDNFISEFYSNPIFDSIVIVSYVIFIYIIQFIIPSKAEQYLKETYPEYELSK